MQIADSLALLADRLKMLRAHGETVALVPTMGALHDGHMALVERARQVADRVAVSIFVNPRQFGPKEDFGAYPRPADADIALLEAAGVHLLWMPAPDQMYPAGYATTIAVARLGDGLCGAVRPGHFDGVTTVVTKLFNQVRPDMALFGEKDWQQLAIIRRMVLDLDQGVTIIGVPIVRAEDGLALSSRNAYLSADERHRATVLPRALKAAVAALESGAAPAEQIATVRTQLDAAGFASIDYVTLADADDLTPLDRLDRPARLLAAARMGGTRLIDNWPVKPAG